MKQIQPDGTFNDAARGVSSKQCFEEAKKLLVKSMAFRLYLGLATICMLMEPFLVGFPPHGVVLKIQIAILAISSFLFVTSIIMIVNSYPDNADSVPLSTQLWDIFFSEFLLEIIGLMLGWIFIFILPGLAALRCFRAFRLLWWYELIAPTYGDDYDPGEDIIDIWTATRSSLKYLKRLGNEIFSAKSRGGAVILTMFFYVTYLFSVVFWVEKGYIVTPDTGYENGYVCGTLPLCFITMMRLALYDGTGFDYFTAIAQEGHKDSYGFATLAIIYTIFTGMILLNGLIGIFGHAFADDEEEEEEERKLIILQESGMLSNTRINRITH